jgi:hypothetical protein
VVFEVTGCASALLDRIYTPSHSEIDANHRKACRRERKRFLELPPILHASRVLKFADGSREGFRMARRRESVFNTLLVLPWWVAVGVGLLGYAAIAFLLPLIWTGTLLASAAKGFAPIGLFWLGLCAVAASGSALRSFLVSRKFDRQAQA